MSVAVCRASLLAALLLGVQPAGAQSPTPSAESAPAAAPAPPEQPSKPVVLASAGSRVLVELTEPVSSQTNKRGDTFGLRLAAPILKDGQIVVPAGATGGGQVVDAQPSGMMGRPSKLVLAARYLEIDGKRVPLKALELGIAGQDNTVTVMAVSTIPYVGIGALFIKGGEIEAPSGTQAYAKLAADYPGAPAAASAPPPTPQTEETAR